MSSPVHVRHTKSLWLAVGMCLILISAGCGLVKSIEDVARVRAQLVKKFPAEYINVNLQGGRSLVIAFVNSPLNQQDHLKRATRAGEAAKIAAANFPGIDGIRSIWVGFVEMESRLIFFHTSRSVDFFAFNNKGATSAGPDVVISDSGNDPLALSVRFNPTRNETDISVMRIQLEGDMNNGIALAPHFTVRGNVQDTTRTPRPPALVGFDFASYSARKLFAADNKLEISCDDKVVFNGQARLLSPVAGGDGGMAQFLTASIPFAEFTKMGDAKNVKITLGPKHFSLTAADIEALKKMAAYAPDVQGNAR